MEKKSLTWQTQGRCNREGARPGELGLGGCDSGCNSEFDRGTREEMPPTWPADVNGKDLSEFADGVLSKEN